MNSSHPSTDPSEDTTDPAAAPEPAQQGWLFAPPEASADDGPSADRRLGRGLAALTGRYSAGSDVPAEDIPVSVGMIELSSCADEDDDDGYEDENEALPPLMPAAPAPVAVARSPEPDAPAPEPPEPESPQPAPEPPVPPIAESVEPPSAGPQDAYAAESVAEQQPQPGVDIEEYVFVQQVVDLPPRREPVDPSEREHLASPAPPPLRPMYLEAVDAAPAPTDALAIPSEPELGVQAASQPTLFEDEEFFVPLPEVDLE